MLKGLQNYKLSSESELSFKTGFNCLPAEVDLEAKDQISMAKVPNDSGCYFWVMDFKGSQYKIYIGRTKSIRRRLKEYSNPFQIHSPNDFKMRFFQSFASERFKGNKLGLYFISFPESRCTAEETRLVREYAPFINQRLVATSFERRMVEGAFQEYYSSIFIRKLSVTA